MAHVERACRPGEGAATCRFLAGTGPFGAHHFCAKSSKELVRVIEERRVAGLMIAQADNCSGPPSFVTIGPMA